MAAKYYVSFFPNTSSSLCGLLAALLQSFLLFLPFHILLCQYILNRRKNELRLNTKCISITPKMFQCVLELLLINDWFENRQQEFPSIILTLWWVGGERGVGSQMYFFPNISSCGLLLQFSSSFPSLPFPSLPFPFLSFHFAIFCVNMHINSRTILWINELSQWTHKMHFYSSQNASVKQSNATTSNAPRKVCECEF